MEMLINSEVPVHENTYILYNRSIKKIQEEGRMNQLFFNDIEYSNRRRKTKREDLPREWCCSMIL